MTSDERQYAPATARNREAIYRCLKDRLPTAGTLLEVASGTGEHAAYLSPLFPEIFWQPTNYDEGHLISTRAWQHHCKRDNFLPVLALDACARHWPVEDETYPHAPFDAIFNANMIHISPWQVCEGLFAGAGRTLKSGSKLFLYGPFKLDGKQTSPSNIQFEKWLTHMDPSFGVRDLSDVVNEASKNNLSHIESCPMPANNFIQVFVKN